MKQTEHRRLQRVLMNKFDNKEPVLYWDMEHRPLHNTYSPIADFFIELLSCNEIHRIIFECKSRKADLAKELKLMKWQRFVPHCDFFYYVLTPGISKPWRIPEQLGVIEIGEDNVLNFKREARFLPAF